MSEVIPQKAIEPLTELCELISASSNYETSAASILKQFLRAMSKHKGYFFNKSWPKNYDYTSTMIDGADSDFIHKGRKEGADRLIAVCLKKNINLDIGFSPLGFLWTLWASCEKLVEGDVKPLYEFKDDPSLFAKFLLGLNAFPYQEKLLRDQSKRTVCCWGRQCGKTSTIAVRAIHYAFCNPDVSVLIASPSLRQSMIMFDRILSFIYGNKILPGGVVRKTRTIIQLLNGSKIVALPCSEHLLRGFTANLVICDEAAFMPEEVITRVLFPMISTTDGSLIFLSTPWGRDHFFYRAYMDSSYSVHHVKSTECPLVKPEFLEEQRRSMSEEAFRVEYLAEFVEAASCFFSQDLIRGCVDPDLEFMQSLEEPVSAGEYYAGVDFGKLGDYSVVSVLSREKDLLNLVYLYEFPLGTPYSNVIGHIVRANSKFVFGKVLVDQTGVGEPVLEELKAMDVENVEGLTFTVKTKEELLTCLKLNMEQKRLKMPYHPRLFGQINQQQYEYSKSGHLSFTHSKGSHDDQLWSLALSCYAATVGREAASVLLKAY